MRKQLLLLLVLLMTAATNTWADGIVCTASDLGKVLCTDGSIYENVSAVPAGKTAAAVIVYVDETNKKGLAIALADEGTMNWSTAKSTCEGKTAITGVKWCLPSQNQWEQMFYANGYNTTSSDGLITTITTAGGAALQGDATYWSSSENSPGVNACTVNLIYDIVGLGNGSEDNVDVRVRACLAFAPPSYAVTLAEGTEDAKNWTIPAEAAAGTAVTATYSGERKVKSVKAVKKAAASLVYPIVISEVTDEAYIGSVVAADGYVYATEDDVVNASKTPVAKICYVGSETGDATYKHGLALALYNVSGTKDWSSTSKKCLDSQYTAVEEAKGDLDGIANTDALVGHGHTHAAASAARGYNSDTHPDGTSAWFLPSVGQWDKMATAVGDYGKLGLSQGYYWSSTERDAENAWSVDNDGSWSTDNKNYYLEVRACLAF